MISRRLQKTTTIFLIGSFKSLVKWENGDNIIYNKSDQILAYAIDFDVIGTLYEVIDKFLAIEKASNSVGLNVN
uniref:Uncharacterized protein n=1 Tax=Megaselia scalaris TaxID=36166 RepID=T1GYU9_MEGSC